MIVRDILPREIAIITEFSVEEIDNLIFCLDHCSIAYDSRNTEEVKKVDYVVSDFYKVLLELREKITNGT